MKSLPVLVGREKYKAVEIQAKYIRGTFMGDIVSEIWEIFLDSYRCEFSCIKEMREAHIIGDTESFACVNVGNRVCFVWKN